MAASTAFLAIAHKRYMRKWEARFILWANWGLDEWVYSPKFLMRVPTAEDKVLTLRELRVRASPGRRVEEVEKGRKSWRPRGPAHRCARASVLPAGTAERQLEVEDLSSFGGISPLRLELRPLEGTMSLLVTIVIANIY